MGADPLKLLSAAACRATPREQAQLSHLFDREIARLLRARRLKLGLTQPAYAARAGVAKNHVVIVELQKARPHLSDLIGAARVLKPADENGTLKMAVELLRQAAKNLLAAAQPIEEAA